MVEISDAVKYTVRVHQAAPLQLGLAWPGLLYKQQPTSSSYNFPLFGYFHLNQTSSMILTSSFASPLSLSRLSYLGSKRQHKVRLSQSVRTMNMRQNKIFYFSILIIL